MQVASIGIGSNSLRMVIAEITDGSVNRLKRYREGLRVFAALDSQNRISADMIEKACQKISDFCRIARQDGAERIHLFATSAVRDAANRLEFAKFIEECSGLPLDICEGEREAALSYWGAFQGDSCSLIDIGGGSTEVICGRGTEILCAKSFQVGAVRLYRDFPVSTMEEAEAAEKKVLALFAGEKIVPEENCRWVGVGGTFTTGVSMLRHLPWEERTQIHGSILVREDVLSSLKELVGLTTEERMKLPWIQPQRADIIVHGLIILLSCFDYWHIPEITVSEYGNLEGYLRYVYDKRIQRG